MGLETYQLSWGGVKSIIVNFDFFISIQATNDMLEILKNLERSEKPIEGYRKVFIVLEKIFFLEVVYNAIYINYKFGF